MGFFCLHDSATSREDRMCKYCLGKGQCDTYDFFWTICVHFVSMNGQSQLSAHNIIETTKKSGYLFLQTAVNYVSWNLVFVKCFLHESIKTCVTTNAQNTLIYNIMTLMWHHNTITLLNIVIHSISSHCHYSTEQRLN